MKQDLSNARNPDLRASLQARKFAVPTDTALVVVVDGKRLRIPAAQLRGKGEAA